MKITVLTLVSSENAAYGASPITSVPNIKKYGEFHEGYRPRSVPAADASDDTGSKTNSDVTKSSNCNRK